MDIKNKTVIRKNLRYETYSGNIDNQKVFVKKLVNPNLRNSLLREISGLISMYELDPEEKIYQVPKLISFENDTLITTWVDGLLMLEKFNEGVVEESVLTLFNLYKYLDSCTTSGIGITRFNKPDKPSNIQVTLERLKSVDIGKYIDEDLILKLGKLLDTNLPKIETRFTHGDLQPGNIIEGSDNKPVIIDCEACSWLYPRHYNIVNFIFNYCMKYEDSSYLEYLNRYFEYIGMNIEENIDLVNFTAGLRVLHSFDEILLGNTEVAKEHISSLKMDLFKKITQNILDEKLFNVEILL